MTEIRARQNNLEEDKKDSQLIFMAEDIANWNNGMDNPSLANCMHSDFREWLAFSIYLKNAHLGSSCGPLRLRSAVRGR